MKLPNKLTLFRILLAPLFIVFFSIDALWALLISIILAIIIELSDLLDGQIARKYEQITDFGKLMDPFADSISRFTIFLSFLGAELAPTWMIAIFFYRDVLVSILRVFSIKSGVVIAARTSGKRKAMAQAICIFAVLAVLLVDRLGWFSGLFVHYSVTQITTGVIFLASLVTAWSAVDYWLANRHIFRHVLQQNTKPDVD